MANSSSVWFEGPVADAVAQVNAKGCVFVVFARGTSFNYSLMTRQLLLRALFNSRSNLYFDFIDESPESENMATLLSEESVVQRLREQSIAIQLFKDSGDAQLFAQLYSIPGYPSLFLMKYALSLVVCLNDIYSVANECPLLEPEL
ncbi:hypothetical protein NQZ79_g8740 [Umbelopsis isabellina]|nr:hypothetical protein NQZ79_g8740 [Umbelopsis isabellina]